MSDRKELAVVRAVLNPFSILGSSRSEVSDHYPDLKGSLVGKSNTLGTGAAVSRDNLGRPVR